MVSLAPGFIVDLATQIGFLSAFLGGFAATLLCMLLSAGKESRIVSVSIALAALSGVAFIVAVMATTQIIATAHPEAPATAAKQSVGGAQVMMALAFALGVYSLLGCIGSAGWIRSRSTGIVTTLIAIAGAVLIALTVVQGGA